MSTENDLDFSDIFTGLDAVSYLPNDPMISTGESLVDDLANMGFNLEADHVPAASTGDGNPEQDDLFWMHMDNDLFKDDDELMDAPTPSIMPSFENFINYEGADALLASTTD